MVSTLGEVQLLFSEELNDPQPSDFTYSEPGLLVQSVTKIDKYTYRLLNNRNPAQGGPLTLSFQNLRDYAGNKITNGSTSYTINLNIPVITAATHTGVSPSGYPSLSVSWYFQYVPTIAGSTVYHVRLTTGAEDCSAGSAITPATATPLVNSTVQTYDNTNSTTIAATTYTFSVNTAVIIAEGAQKILVCVDNVNNNKHGIGVINIVRDDTAPTSLTVSPAGGNFVAPQALTFQCSDNVDKIIFNSATNSAALVDPVAGDVTEPSFNTANGAVVSGTTYNPNNKPVMPFVANTTRTIYKYRCIDKAGNIYPPNASAALVSGVYRVNTSFPTVNYISLTKTAAVPAVNITGVGLGGHTSATLTWSTNQVGQAWEIRSGGTDCGVGGTVVASSAIDGVSPSPANTPIQTTFAYNATGIAVGLNDLRICVTNGSDWGQAGLTLLRDDSAPAAPTVNIPAGDYGTTQNLVFSCSDNEDRVAYTMSTAVPGVAPADPLDPTFDGDGRLTFGQVQAGPLAVTTDSTALVGKRTRVKFRCIDKAGHVSSVGDATYTIDSLLPTVTVQNQDRTAISPVAGAYNSVQITWVADRQISGYQIRRDSTNCIDGFTFGGVGTNLSGSSTLPAGTVTTTTIAASAANFPDGDKSYTILICARNSINANGYTARTVIYDGQLPSVPTPTASLVALNATTFTLTWTAATDNVGGSGVAGYRIFRSATAGTYSNYPATPTYTATSSPATISMPDVNPYYLKIVPFDAAGNLLSLGAAYTELATKPTINIVVTGNSGNLKLKDGNTNPEVIVAGSMAWATSLTLGDTYSFSITEHPPGQVCSIREKQFGTLNANLTININCITGYMVGGRFQSVAPVNTPSMLYRTRAEVWQSSFAVVGELPNSLAVAGGFVFWGTDGDCDAGAPVSYCIYKTDVNSAGVRTLVTSGVPGVIRGMATDGTNVYYTTLTDNRLYKIPVAGGTPVEVASGFSNPFGIALDGDDIYVCSRAANEIVKVDLRTGQKTTVVSGVASPLGIVVVGNDLYFTRAAVNAIYQVPKTGGVVVAALGQTTAGHVDGVGSVVRLNEPHDLMYDGKGNLIFTEYGNHIVRRAHLATGRVTTLVGDSAITAMAYTNGSGASADLPRPVGIAGDGRNMFISLHGDRRIIKLSEDKLTGYWAFANNSDDYSSDAPAVTPNWIGAAAFTAGRFAEANGAAQFDGSRHMTTKNFNFTVNQPFTFSAWVRVTDLTAVRPIIGNVADFEFQWYIATNGSVNFQNWYNSGALTNYISGTSAGVVKTNTWVHLTYVYHGTGTQYPGGRIYVNGYNMTAASSQASASLLDSFASSVTIGATRSHASKFVGSMADVRIYNRALSEGEINELAQDTGTPVNSGPTELIAHYEMSGYTPSGALAQNLLGGTTSAVGKDGDTAGAFNFTGGGSLFVDAATIAALPKENAPRTMCAFIRPMTYPPAGNYVSPVSYGGASSGREFGLAISRDAGTNIFISNTFNSAFDHSVAYKPPLYTWTHVCASHDGTDARLYIDGVLMGTKPVTLSTSVSSTVSGAFRVGAWFDDAHRFSGDIDDVRIYNKALSLPEIRQIAVQVPAGLISRYDLSVDTNDNSGVGANLSNANATQTDDRFGLNSRAHKFNGSAVLTGTTITQATTDITFAAWIQPATLDGAYVGILGNYNGTDGVGGSGGGIFLTPSNQLLFISKTGVGAPNANNDCATTYTPPIGVYTHIAVTQSSAGPTSRVYVNGSLIRTCTPSVAVSFFNGANAFKVGEVVFPTRFNGNIDDVRIYNRALPASAIQALVQQPNRRIFVTANTYNGNLGGITGADTKCNNVADVNKPPGIYKAMLVDAATSGLRRACTAANCATSGVAEGIDWVLTPNITYLRADNTAVFTANFNGVFSFPAQTFYAPISTSSFEVWTGINFGVGGEWTVDGGPGQCALLAGAGWTNSLIGGSNGVFGNSGTDSQTVSATPVGIFYTGFETASCLTARRLYCVEQ
ncbi:MAG: LamG-like jellyroll fold domain-containing protein [Turneriella sp.]